MTITIAHLGPAGTNAEAAAQTYQTWLQQAQSLTTALLPCQSIAQSLYALAHDEVQLAVIPVENSIQGSVAIALDLVWELHPLSICQQIILPIHHALISFAEDFSQIKEVRSHPQALAQCQRWLEKNLPHAALIEANSTTAVLGSLQENPHLGAIAAPRAAKLYDLPILVDAIGDFPQNCTRFWVLSKTPQTAGEVISLAFTLPAKIPGVLVKALEVFARRQINLSRIESRPTKRSLGEYLFFIDLDGCLTNPDVQAAIAELQTHTEILKILGNYKSLPLAAIQPEK
ncbi:prephenate dehydratase [[Synechococcus] sp. NIES-970]|uniref:prephenate dehydratase n=1 Tax=Picosynechococcus sp. NKBG15041c TaxID=1407650 RepID=UPI00040ACBCB|nr:prephenate dehydratase [Picosynechococcus sp. NKBG15041c]BAW97507.1 prephenate dehydratase [[Synechococcus] sp. NIES-970]